MKDCLKKVYFLTISVFLFHCSMNMEDKVLLDKEQIIDSNFSKSFVENFNKNKNFSSSYNIFFSEEVDEKLISSFIKHYPKGSDVQLLLQPEDLEHDDQSNLKLEVVDRKFRGTNFIYTLKTNSDLLIPVFVHSHHVHQHEVDEKFGIKRPINIDHIVCF